MTAKSIINKTIKELKEISTDANDRLSKYDNDLVTVNEMLDVVKGLNSDIVGYNPDKAFELLKEHNLEVFGIKEIFTDVQNIVEYSVKNNEKVNLDDYDEYKLKITELRNNLSLLKELIEKRLIGAKQKISNEEDIVNLENLLEVFSSPGEKYVTEEMLMSLNKTILIKCSLEDVMPIYNELFKTDNLKLKIEEKKEASTIEDVIELFAEILPEVNASEYLRAKKEQILKNINLENARKIINFFKEKKIINFFDKMLLVKIVTQADYDSIVETYNELREKVQNDSDMEPYCSDSVASIWIKKRSEVNGE